MKTGPSKFFTGLTRNTFLLAFTSLFADISSEMLYPLLPIFLTQYLGAGGGVVGIVEGVAETTQNLVQGFSGRLSDRLQKRKGLALFGYVLGAVSKPLIGLATGWPAVLGARFLDRFGSGTRSAPRDALIASSAGEKNRGKAFGLEGIGDNLGAFIGPLVAILFLFSLRFNIRTVFYLSIIPGLLAVVMILSVREKDTRPRAESKAALELARYPRAYWKYLAAIGVFGLGNSSNAFLILQTKDMGVSFENTIFIYAAYNLAAAAISYPSGSLSDKLGRKNILLLALLIFFATYLGFAFAMDVWLIAGLFILYGLYQGIFRAVGKALASDFVPPSLHAGSIGWFAATVGLSGLIASIVAGQLWDRMGHRAVFLYGMIFSFLGMAALWVLVRTDKPRGKSLKSSTGMA